MTINPTRTDFHDTDFESAKAAAAEDAALPPDTLTPPKVSLTSSLRGRKAVFTSWVIANPFVSSFIEDEIQGTAKKTRTNTLLNRNASESNLEALARAADAAPTMRHAPSMQELRGAPSMATTRPLLRHVSSSRDFSRVRSSSSTSSSPAISFSEEVHTYLPDAAVDAPVIESIRRESRRPPLASRTAHPSRPPALDPSKPLSQGGRWIQQQKM